MFLVSSGFYASARVESTKESFFVSIDVGPIGIGTRDKAGSRERSIQFEDKLVVTRVWSDTCTVVIFFAVLKDKIEVHVS